MRKLPVEMEKLKQALRDEVKVEVDRSNDWKFFLRAAICKRLFHDFDACNGYFGLEHFAQDKMITVISIADFAKFKEFTATISKLTKPPSLEKPDLEKSLLLERFFFKKFKFIFGVDPLTLYRDELAAGKSACHQQFVFYQSFLNVAVSVWLLHRLVHPFDEEVDMLTSEAGCSFQTRNMESVVSGIMDDNDEEHDVHTKVLFPVIPGFQVSRSVIKCAVYVPDQEVDRSEQATAHRPPIDKSPVTPPISSDKTLIKLDPSFTKSSPTDKPTTKLEMPFANYDETPIKLDPSTTESSSSSKPPMGPEMLFAHEDDDSSRSSPNSSHTPDAGTRFFNYGNQVLETLLDIGRAVFSDRSSMMRPLCRSSKTDVRPAEASQAEQSVENQKKERHGVPESLPSGESIVVPPPLKNPLHVPRHQRRPEAPSPSTQKESSNRNNKSEGYHLPVAPPGSYQDDDTGPSPRTLVTAVIGMKRVVTHFANVLDTDMKKYPVEMERLKQAIRDEVKAEVERPNDWKFLVRAFLCQRLFHEFNAPNGFYGLEDCAQDKTTTINSFADFTKFKDLSATIAKLMQPPSPDKPDLEKSKFLERFCFKKFKFIFNEDTLPLYRDELAAVQSGCHPNTSFYQSFLNVAVSVWLLHRLVHSFDEKVDMLTYEPGCPFQRQNMESVVPGVIDDDEDEENDVNIKVAFTVIPGFQVSMYVIKCAVYCRDEKVDRSQLPPRTDPPSTRSPSNLTPPPTSPAKTPISSDETPFKLASSNVKNPAKSSFNNKPSTNLETLFANDDGTHSSRSHPGRLQTPGGVTSLSICDSQVPTRSGDVVAATVANAVDNWQTQQARSSPGNSARATPKSKFGVWESSSERHAHAQLASTTSVDNQTAPASAVSRPYNPNGAPLAARDTKLSEARRLMGGSSGVWESSSERHAHAQLTSTTGVDNHPAPTSAVSRPYNPNGAPLAARDTKLSEARRLMGGSSGVWESSSERHAHAQLASTTGVDNHPAPASAVLRPYNPNGAPLAARETKLSEARRLMGGSSGVWESSSERHAHAQLASTTGVDNHPAPTSAVSRPYNPNGAPLAARDTKLSEARRLMGGSSGVWESSSERHAHAQLASTTSVDNHPAPASAVSRPYNPNGAPLAARDTKLSEARRLMGGSSGVWESSSERHAHAQLASTTGVDNQTAPASAVLRPYNPNGAPRAARETKLSEARRLMGGSSGVWESSSERHAHAQLASTTSVDNHPALASAVLRPYNPNGAPLAARETKLSEARRLIATAKKGAHG